MLNFVLEILLPPLYPNSDHHVTSPYHVTSLSIMQSRRIQEMITRNNLSLLSYKFSLLVTYEICENGKENTYVDIGD